MGLPLNIFIECSQDFVCAICENVAHDSRTVCDQGHLFCAKCIDEWTVKIKPPGCPTCNRSIQLARNRIIDRIILKLQVKCPNSSASTKPEGECRWTGHLSDVEAHYGICELCSGANPAPSSIGLLDPAHDELPSGARDVALLPLLPERWSVGLTSPPEELGLAAMAAIYDETAKLSGAALVGHLVKLAECPAGADGDALYAALAEAMAAPEAPPRGERRPRRPQVVRVEAELAAALPRLKTRLGPAGVDVVAEE